MIRGFCPLRWAIRRLADGSDPEAGLSTFPGCSDPEIAGGRAKPTRHFRNAVCSIPIARISSSGRRRNQTTRCGARATGSGMRDAVRRRRAPLPIIHRARCWERGTQDVGRDAEATLRDAGCAGHFPLARRRDAGRARRAAKNAMRGAMRGKRGAEDAGHAAMSALRDAFDRRRQIGPLGRFSTLSTSP